MSNHYGGAQICNMFRPSRRRNKMRFRTVKDGWRTPAVLSFLDNCQAELYKSTVVHRLTFPVHFSFCQTKHLKALRKRHNYINHSLSDQAHSRKSPYESYASEHHLYSVENAIRFIYNAVHYFTRNTIPTTIIHLTARTLSAVNNGSFI